MKSIKTQIAVIALMLVSTIAIAQNNENEISSPRQGFMMELGLGGGVISIEDSEGVQTFDEAQGAISFPELKFGYFLKEDLAVTVAMPGMIYEFQDNDRHFGGFIPSLQYWVKDIQSKLVLGRAFLDGDVHRDAITFNIGIGLSCL